MGSSAKIGFRGAVGSLDQAVLLGLTRGLLNDEVDLSDLPLARRLAAVPKSKRSSFELRFGCRSQQIIHMRHRSGCPTYERLVL